MIWQPKYICLRLDILVIVPVLLFLLGMFVGSFFQDETCTLQYKGALQHAQMEYVRGFHDAKIKM